MATTDEKENITQKAKNKSKELFNKTKEVLTPDPNGRAAKIGGGLKNALNLKKHPLSVAYGALNAFDTWQNGGSAMDAAIAGAKGYGEGVMTDLAFRGTGNAIQGGYNAIKRGVERAATQGIKEVTKQGLKQGLKQVGVAGVKRLAANPYLLPLGLVAADAINVVGNDKPSAILNTLGLVKESVKKPFGMDDRNAIDKYGQAVFDAIGGIIPDWLVGGKQEDMVAGQARVAESDKVLEEYNKNKNSKDALKANQELGKKSNKEIRKLHEETKKDEKIKQIETELGLRQAEQAANNPYVPARGEIVERFAPEQLPQSVTENPDDPSKWAVPEGHGLIKNSKGEYIHVAPSEYRAADQYGGGITDRWEETQAYIDKQARENEAEKQLLRDIATAPWYSPQMQANAVATLNDMLRHEEVQAKGLNASLYDAAAQHLIDQDNNLTKLLANDAEGKYNPTLHARLLQEQMSQPDRLQGVNLANPVERQRYLAQQLAINGVNKQVVNQFGPAFGLNNVGNGRTTFDHILNGLGLKQPELPMVNGDYVDTTRLSPTENEALRQIAERNQKISILQELQRERDESFGRAK